MRKKTWAWAFGCRFSRAPCDVVGTVVATVIEDRAPLGVGGRRLLRIRLELSGVADPVDERREELYRQVR